jgi:hypothetical protein
MALRIAFDLDGVVADMDAALVREARKLFSDEIVQQLLSRRAPHTHGETGVTTASAPPAGGLPGDNGNRPAPPTMPPPRITMGHWRRLWRHVGGIRNFWESLDEIEPGTLSALARLAADRRWEILFVSRRPETAGDTAQVQSQRWLEARGFQHPSVFIVRHRRGRLAAALALDFVVDDSPENCFSVVADSDARAILVWRGGESGVPGAAERLGISVVSSATECLPFLIEADRTERPVRIGLVARIRSLLGWAG